MTGFTAPGLPAMFDSDAANRYYDLQYNARASVQDPLALIAGYTSGSQAAFALPGARLDQAYGQGRGDRLDVYPAAQAAAPIFLFIHGGYWRALSRRDSAFMAPALTAAGACVVVPDYDLAPAASLDQMVDQMRRALAWVWRHAAEFGGDRDRIVLCGSSAGGHLLGMLLAADWQADYGLPQRSVVSGALALSGLFDLQPLLGTHINAWMQLDDPAAVRNSPRFQLPGQASHGGCQLLVACGEYESQEFKRQSAEYLAAWRARRLPGRWLETPGTNHFDLPLGLADTLSAVYAAALELLGLQAGAGPKDSPA